MTATLAPASERPASFDARLTAYLPGLYKLARKYEPQTHLELAHEVVVRLCANWASFREDGGFWNWAVFTMRSLARDRREKKRVPTVGLEAAYSKSTEPNQEHASDLRTVLASLRGRDGEIVLGRAMGDEAQELAAHHRVSKNRLTELHQRGMSAARAAYA